MKKIVKKTAVIFLLFLAGIRVTSYFQEEVNIDELMGQSIQKYLEGDIKGTIEALDKILTAEPGHERARGLLIKASDRLTEKTKSTGNYDKGLEYLSIAEKHLPDSKKIADNIKKIKLLKSSPEKAKAEEKKDAACSQKNFARTYPKTLRRQNS